MKLRSLIIGIIIITLPAISLAARITVAVVDIDCSSDISQSQQRALSDRLETELIKTGVFSVFERQEIAKVLDEVGFRTMGFTREDAIEIGRLVGVDYIILGSIVRMEYGFAMNMKMVSVETGMIQMAKSHDGHETLRDVLTKDLRIIARKLAYNTDYPKLSLGYLYGDFPLNIKGFGNINQLLNDADVQEHFALPVDKEVMFYNGFRLEISGRTSKYMLLELGEIPTDNANIFFLNFGSGGKIRLYERYGKYVSPSVLIEGSLNAILFDLDEFPDEIVYEDAPTTVGQESIKKEELPGTVGFNLNLGGEVMLMQRVTLQMKMGFFYSLKNTILKQTGDIQGSPLEAEIGGSGVNYAFIISILL